MKKLLGIVVLGLLLSGNAYSAILNYDCTAKKASSDTLWYTDVKKTVDTDKKTVKEIYKGVYKPLFGKRRDILFTRDIPIEIDDQFARAHI